MEAMSQKMMTTDEMKKVKHILKQNSIAVHDDELLDRLGIERAMIRSGVRCMACLSVGMQRVYSTWHCGSCGCRNKNAHMATSQEYQLLFGRQITTNDVMWWLGIDDKHLARRLLKQMSEDSTGTNRNRSYKLKFEPWLLEHFLATEIKKF